MPINVTMTLHQALRQLEAERDQLDARLPPCEARSMAWAPHDSDGPPRSQVRSDGDGGG